MHGHVLEVVKSRVELVNHIINRVMHVGKYIYNGRRITHTRNNRIILLSFISLFSFCLTDDYITIHKMDTSTLSFLTKNLEFLNL